MNNCDLGAESLIAFATVLLTNKSVTAISLSNPRLTSLQGETVVHIASMLLVNRTLTYLDLSKNKVRDSHLEHLTESLKRNNTLQVLKLRGFESCSSHFIEFTRNEISAEGGALMGSMLRRKFVILLPSSSTLTFCSKTLTEIDLSANRIGSDGCIELSAALESNTTLTQFISFLVSSLYSYPSSLWF